MSTLRAPRNCTLACARCGRSAAEVALLPGSEHGDSAWRHRDRLERTDFMGSLIRFGEAESLTQLFEAICRQDFAAARKIDPDFVSFHCLPCSRAYCQACWQMDAPVFDEGFYDYTMGVCPEGHRQIVDD